MRKARYPLTRDAACQVAYACCTNPTFYEMLGYAVEFDRIQWDDCALLISVAQDIARENPQPCASGMAAIQGLRNRVNAGRLTMEDLERCNELLSTVEDLGGVTDVDGLIATVSPAIKQIASVATLEEVITSFGKKADPVEAAERFTAVAAIGRARATQSVLMDFTAEQIAADACSTVTDALPTGIPELDVALGGGVERSALGVFLANSGDGKSLALCHIAACAMRLGKHVAYITAELQPGAIRQRVYCNLFNMTALDMSMQPTEAARRGQALIEYLQEENGQMGTFNAHYLTPKVGTVSQIAQWLKDEEKKHGFVPDVLLVDYADKLASKAAGDAAKGSYAEQGAIYQQLRDLIVARNIWGWTASQTTGRQGRKKQLDIEDIADSMEKARICDTLIAIVRSDEETQNGTCRFRIPKRRNGQAHQTVGPLVMDPEHGRMVTIVQHEPW